MLNLHIQRQSSFIAITAACHKPARYERRDGNVMISGGKLQQLLVSFDDLLMLTVNVRKESAVNTPVI